MSPRPQSPVATEQNGNASKPNEKAQMENKQMGGHQTEVDVSGTEHRENNVATPVGKLMENHSFDKKYLFCFNKFVL